MSAENPDSVDAGITRFFFFDRNETLEKEHVPFTENFAHKYLISIDGTVAAYRLPQLLLGNSLVMKQKSQYYEHYYSLLNKNKPHVLEVANDLSDLERKLDWIRKNQEEAQEMIKNANDLVDTVLQPINVYSYWLKVIQVNFSFFEKIYFFFKFPKLFQTYAERADDYFTPIEEMEHVPQPRSVFDCACHPAAHTEL